MKLIRNRQSSAAALAAEPWYFVKVLREVTQPGSSNNPSLGAGSRISNHASSLLYHLLFCASEKCCSASLIVIFGRLCMAGGRDCRL